MLQADLTAPPAASAPATGTSSDLRGRLAAGLLLAGVVLHLLFLLSLRFGWLNPLFNDTCHRFGPGGDFFSIYAAGVKARAGQSVYTVGGHVEAVPYAYAFRYAPFVAYVVGVTLARLPAVAAYAVWLIACEMALLRNVRLTLEMAPDRRTGYVAAALWLLFTPYYLELFVGQFTFITASLVFWAYLGWRGAAGSARIADGFWADGFWAAAVWLKMMPLLFLPVVLLRGRWRIAVAASLALIGSSAAYFLRFPQDWRVFAATNGDAQPAGHAGNLGLMALLYHAFFEHMRPFLVARAAVLALAGMSLAWLTYRAWQVLPRSEAQRQGADGRLKPKRKKPGTRQNKTSKNKIRQDKTGQDKTGQDKTGQDKTGQSANAGARSAERLGTEGLEAEGTESGRASAQVAEDRLLVLYAACSAVYLLTYKDVWEHHYVLLLPPVVLLFLRGQTPWLWLPPFLISALPGLFALYDLPGLGYNEDPQVYWRHGTSLLHHMGKPLAPLWLLTGLLAQSLVRPAWRITQPVHRRALQAVASCLLCLVFLGGALWARTAIARQKRMTQELVWSAQVFQKQQTAQTCGPAALAAVCRHYGIPATEAEIARLAGTTPQGTSMLGLQAAARAKGLTAEGERMTINALSHAPCPCILFFHPGHFAVLIGVRGLEARGLEARGLEARGSSISGITAALGAAQPLSQESSQPLSQESSREFYLADPSLGQRTMTAGQLGSLWHGEVLIIGPTIGRHASASAP